MPFTVQDLLVDKVKPVTVKITDSAKTAITLMMDGDFSQLPVVDEQEKVVGMITSDSIVRALNHLRLTIEELRVTHAYRPVPKTFTVREEIFDILDGLRDAYAVLIVDKENKVLGIVTNYDTATYFRSRAEDMMLVEDIENAVKDCVRTDLLSGRDDLGDDDLMVVVGDESDNKSDLRASFGKEVGKILKILGASPSNSQQASINELIGTFGGTEPPAKAFSKLNLNQHITLFMDDTRWAKYGPRLELPKKSCRDLLDGVRQTRNDLFHFRTELPADRRDELRFCRDWLNKNQSSIVAALRPAGAEEAEPTTLEVLVEDKSKARDAIRVQLREALEETPQLMEAQSSETSKYSGIGTFLQTLPPHIQNVLVTFDEIESIIESELPRAAYEHRAWWANDPVSHVQSREWIEVGWRVSSINISQQKVTFSRVKDREQRYIGFFSGLITRLREGGLEMKDLSPTGRSFLPMDNIASETNQITFISCSFARGGRFRVELYIDSGSYLVNDFVFDALFSIRDKIERAISTPIEWERLDEKRASRIAAYHPGSITDSESELASLQEWAEKKVIEFYSLFQHDLRETIIDMAHEAEERRQSND